MIYDRYYDEFSALSISDLSDVRRALDNSLKDRKKRELKALREEISKKAAELGVDVAVLLKGAGSGKAPGKKIQPKYRMVDADGKVYEWSGRGIKPKFFAQYSKEELEARFAINR